MKPVSSRAKRPVLIQEARVHEAAHPSPPPPPWQTHTPSWMALTLLQPGPHKRATICMYFQKSKHLLGSEVSWCDHRLAQTPKEAFSKVRVHAGTTQVDFEVDHQPPADSPPGDHLITMVKETHRRVSKRWKKVKLVRVSHRSKRKRYWLRDCLWMCQTCKPAWSWAYEKKFSPGRTQLPTSWHLLSTLRQDPLEATLVIFGRRALIFFCVWKLLEKNEEESFIDQRWAWE